MPGAQPLPAHAYLVQFPDQETCEQALEDNRRYFVTLCPDADWLLGLQMVWLHPATP
jgi:hypothetical protein